MTDYTKALLSVDEGTQTSAYRDKLGIWTVGIGHNLQANGLPREIARMLWRRCGRVDQGTEDPVPYPDCIDIINAAGGMVLDEIDALYDIDVRANCGWLWEKPWWPAVDAVRQAALNDMAFNLGERRAQQFTTFYGLVSVGDWPAAASDLEFNTLVAKELPHRYGRIEAMLRTGVLPAGISP